jgi:hypothetical protein
MASNNSHLLKRFFILVNSSQEFRMKFLLDPIPYIKEALPDYELTSDMIEDIMEIREKLVEVHGIVAIPPGIEGLIDNLREGADLPKFMEDDSVVC